MNGGKGESICILQHSGIGNLIHLTPMVTAIRQIKPAAEIYLLTHPRSGHILYGWEMLTELVMLDATTFIMSLGATVDWLIISPTGARFDPIIQQCCHHILQQPIQGFWTRHEVEVNMDFAREMGYQGITPPSLVIVYEENHVYARATLARHGINKRDFIVINACYLRKDPWPMKHWGNGKYHRLIRWLWEEKGYRTVFLGTEDDFENAEAIIDGAPFGLNLCGTTPDIKDAAAIIGEAKMVVGNDGGLMHIASAMGIPTVTIFTFTNPVMSAPRTGEMVMRPCAYRLQCQYDQYDHCEERGCLDVPYEDVQAVVDKSLSDS